VVVVTSPSVADPLAACAAYRRVERAIDLVRAAGVDAPDLASLARSVAMRPFTFQRTFSAWAGVSPKRFAQVLAAARARVALGENRDVLGAALEAGLSGPGRLHDLLVSVEACSPGEVRSRGEGLEIRWAVGPTPFGEAFVAATPRGVHRLEFVDRADAVDAVLSDLARAWPRAAPRRDERAASILSRAFAPAGRPRPFHLWVRGTNLQVAVWRALLRIPVGSLATYSDVARFVSAPRSVRAVASSVARNPVAFVIPCHRVLARDGDLAGYAWGLARKAALLGREAAAGGARPGDSSP
jgi:AraC family transcriptional regulator of adaptative response/methylated-DNA-[protein]-cysteine methyltransferase